MFSEKKRIKSHCFSTGNYAQKDSSNFFMAFNKNRHTTCFLLTNLVVLHMIKEQNSKKYALTIFVF